MRRMRQGWQLTKKSWGVLKTNRQLTLFVIFGGITAFVFTAAMAVPGVLLIDANKTAPGVILIVIGAYFATFIALFFNVGLAASADAAMKGEPISFGQGLSRAGSRGGQIAGWALLAVTVNLILSAIQSESGVLGRIVSGLFSMAWNLVTFLVVPVIALEGLGPFAALKRSAGLFKQRWGQQVTGNIAIGGLVILVTILPALALGAIGVLIVASGGNAAVGGGVALIAVALALFVVGAVVSSAMRGVFGVALYHFADTGQPAGGFTAEELQGSIQSKRR